MQGGSPPPGYVALGSAELVERFAAGIRLRAESAIVEIVALAPDLFRVGMFERGRPIDYRSEAIAKPDWPSHPVDVIETASGFRVATSRGEACVGVDPLRIGFQDAGRVFAADDPALGMGFVPGRELPEPLGAMLGPGVRVYKQRPASERYFGCGERTSGLDKTDSHQTFWNVDPPIGHTASHDNLYTSIPFLLALDRGQAWGLLFDNSRQVEFDLAHEVASRSWFGADGGNLVYYIFAGPTPAEVLDRYTELTGRTPLPPLWALGNHQSRWGYTSADRLREVAREFRQRDIPCDALYLDIDYMDGYRVFTWDRTRFPEPQQLLSELAGDGFKVVTILDPGVKVDEDYSVYTSGRAADVFCKTRDNREYRNVVWPGLCAFPDFTSPAARAWWGEQLAGLVEQGVAGIWCDMNEPTVFVPLDGTLALDAVHPGGGETKLHAEVHNVYGSLMARATREAVQRLRPHQRPFVISRAGFAGLQRHALQWTGDNSSWWEHLWMSMPQLQNMGLSGVAWVGVDVGGFGGESTGELLARWTELGAFEPFCRNHTARATRDQEPWAFGEPYESAIRKMLKLRQRLIPYLYTLFERCHATGAPIFRPLLFEYPTDETTYTTDDEFLVGDCLLVAPIVRPGVEYRHVYLPAGTWCHWWSGQRYDGPTHILAHAPLGEPAMYARANAPIPLWPEMAYVGQHPPDPLSLVVFPAEGSSSVSLYEDPGEGFEHERGMYARTRLACRTHAGRTTLEIGPREGGFAPQRTRLEVEFRGLSSPPREVHVDGQPFHWHHEGNLVSVHLAASAAAQRIELA